MGKERRKGPALGCWDSSLRSKLGGKIAKGKIGEVRSMDNWKEVESSMSGGL